MKPHRGTIYGQRIHLPEGDILLGRFIHPDGKVTLRFTSLIVQTEGKLVETLNSFYTFEATGDFDVEGT